jgi:hypothetical protein
MRSLIKLLEPDRFEDLMALNALYRPGPLNNGLHTEYAERKHGRRKVTYPHPDLEPVLGSTYGVMVYQEQIMQIAVVMAGYSLGQADELRRVMSKKKRELIGAERTKFVSGCIDQGHPERLATDLFDMIEPFADYGFPAAHACAYGYVAYQTAYLMAHHRVECLSAVLTSVKDDKDRKPFYLYACRGHGRGGAAARRQRVRDGLRARPRRGAPDPLRALGRAQRGRGRRGPDHRRAPREGRLRVVHGLLQEGGALGADEARAGVADAGRRIRLAGVCAPRVAGEPGEGLRAHPGRTQVGGGRPVLPVRQRRRRERRGADRRVGPARRGVRTARAVAQREGDAGPVRDGSPAPGGGGCARRADEPRHRGPGVARRRRPRDRRRHRSARSRASTRSAASRTPCCAWRAWPAA